MNGSGAYEEQIIKNHDTALRRETTETAKANEQAIANTNYDYIMQVVFSICIYMNMDNYILSHIYITKDEMLEAPKMNCFL